MKEVKRGRPRKETRTSAKMFMTDYEHIKAIAAEKNYQLVKH